MDAPKPSKNAQSAQKEIEISLGELEERVDRLRALYEQYFMGYEKIEPGVQRKDVDRRFAILRKANIRNTALRFRFNVVTQKYNTYSMYWTRVCRQIEEGTFKRHVARAAKRFSGPSARGSKREVDVPIDVDLGDFDDMSVDDALAEASAIPSTQSPLAASTRDLAVAAPASARELPVATPSEPRIMRPAAVPGGVRPRLIVRRAVAGPPPAPPAAAGIDPTSSARMPTAPRADGPPRRAPPALPSQTSKKP